MKIIWFVAGAGLLWFSSRKIEKRFRQRKREKTDEETRKNETYLLLKKVKDLKKWDEGGYARETAEAIHSHNEKIESAIDRLIDMENETEMKKEVKRLEEETEILTDQIKQAHQSTEQLLLNMKEKVSYIESYLDTTNFYPPHFALDNNKLSGMIVEIEDRRHVNPLLSVEKYQLFSENLYKEVHRFQKLHAEVTMLIELFDEQKQSMSKEKIQQVMEDKNALYIALHRAEWEEVNNIHNRMKKLLA